MLVDLHEMLEAKAYASLLTESARIDYLKKNFSNKVTEKAANTPLPADILDEVNAAEGETLGDRIITYVVNYDPSPNKQYAQWIIHRFVRDKINLEDLGRAYNALSWFDRAKGRLQVKDINAYPDLTSLETAIDPFRNGKQDVSKQAERKRLKSDENTDVLYDGDDLLVVRLKTQEAAEFWGKNTRWCTTMANSVGATRFNTYNSRGPLYVIIERDTNRKFQFHFPTKQFMDEADRRIDLRAFVDKHPHIMDILGRVNFLQIPGMIGIKHFRPDEVLRLERRILLQQVETLEDVLALPEEIRDDPAVAYDLVFHFSKLSPDIVNYYLVKKKLITLDQFDERMSITFLNALPPRFQTDERKIAVAEASGRHDTIAEIKRPWPERVEEIYWGSRVNDWGMWTSYTEIPEKVRTKEMLRKLILSKLPFGDEKRINMIKQEVPFLKKDDIIWLCERNLEIYKYLPEKAFDPSIVEVLSRTITEKYVPAEGQYSRDYLIISNTRHPAGKVILDITRRAPLGWWSIDVIRILLKHDREIKFSQIPESKRTPEIVESYLEHQGRESILDIPGKLLTKAQIVKHCLYKHSLLNELDESIVGEDIVLGVLNQDRYLLIGIDKSIPKRLYTPRVYDALISKGLLPIEKFPSSLLTVEAIAKRLASTTTNLKEEFEAIPSWRLTPVTVIEFVKSTPMVISFVPDSLMSEPLLLAYLEQSRASNAFEEQFRRFPKTMWSKSVVAKAVELKFIEPKVDEIPKDHFSREAAIAVLAKDASQIGRVPEDYLDENTLCEVILRNPEVVDRISDDKISEPVVHAAMRFAGVTAGTTKESIARLLERTPKELLSQRIYEQIVGYLVPLKSVPKKFRTNKLITAAIERDPVNLRVLSNPTEWMKTSPLLSRDEYYWINKLENAGFFFVGTGRARHLIDVEDLEKEKMPSGGSIVVKKVGTKNLRVFVFDKKNKMVGRFWTHDGKFVMPYGQDLMAHRQTVLDAFATHREFQEFNAGDLNKIHFYDSDYSIQPEEAIQRVKASERSNVAWSKGYLQGSKKDTYHSRDLVLTAWLENKPIIRFSYTKTQAAFGQKSWSINVDKIFDMKAAMKYSHEIYGYLKNEGYIPGKLGYGSEWLSLGYLRTKNEVSFLRKKEVLKSGKMSVWLGDNNRVAIFGPDGLIAHARLTKTGKITAVSPHYKYSGEEQLIGQIFALAEPKITPKEGK